LSALFNALSSADMKAEQFQELTLKVQKRALTGDFAKILPPIRHFSPP